MNDSKRVGELEYTIRLLASGLEVGKRMVDKDSTAWSHLDWLEHIAREALDPLALEANESD